MKVTKIYPDSNGLVDIDEHYLVSYFPEANYWQLNPRLDYDLRLKINSFLLDSLNWRYEFERFCVRFSDAYEFYSCEEDDSPYLVLFYDCGLDCLFD